MCPRPPPPPSQRIRCDCPAPPPRPPHSVTPTPRACVRNDRSAKRRGSAGRGVRSGAVVRRSAPKRTGTGLGSGGSCRTRPRHGAHPAAYCEGGAAVWHERCPDSRGPLRHALEAGGDPPPPARLRVDCSFRPDRFCRPQTIHQTVAQPPGPAQQPLSQPPVRASGPALETPLQVPALAMASQGPLHLSGKRTMSPKQHRSPSRHVTGPPKPLNAVLGPAPGRVAADTWRPHSPPLNSATQTRILECGKMGKWGKWRKIGGGMGK